MKRLGDVLCTVRLAFIACAVIAAEANAAVEVKDVRLWRAPDHTRIVLDLSGPTTHNVMELVGPDRLVLDVKGAAFQGVLTDLPLEGTPITRVRSGIRGGEDLRVVFDLAAKIEPSSFELKPNERTGHRLVLDLYDTSTTEAAVPPKPAKTVQQVDTRRPVVVAIDAGHGGKDPGASRPNKLREKTVVLAIAKRLKKKLEALCGKLDDTDSSQKPHARDKSFVSTFDTDSSTEKPPRRAGPRK